MDLTAVPRVALVGIMGRLGARDRARCSILCRLLRDVVLECHAHPEELWERMHALLERVDAAVNRRRGFGESSWAEIDMILAPCTSSWRTQGGKYTWMMIEWPVGGFIIKTWYKMHREWWRRRTTTVQILDKDRRQDYGLLVKRRRYWQVLSFVHCPPDELLAMLCKHHPLIRAVQECKK